MERKLFVTAAVAAGLLVVATTASAINCEQARKAAGMGRTVDEIAETMIADPADVKKCLDEGKKAGDEKKPAAPEAGSAK